MTKLASVVFRYLMAVLTSPISIIGLCKKIHQFIAVCKDDIMMSVL